MAIAALLLSSSAWSQSAPPSVQILERGSSQEVEGPPHLQADCPVSWCAPNLRLEIQDAQGNSMVPTIKSGWGFLPILTPPTRLVFTNTSYTRQMALFSVNGINPLDGKPALRKSKGYLVPARGQLVVESTVLPGGQWFSSLWPSQGTVNLTIYQELSDRPMLGGGGPQPPPEAMSYLKDGPGNAYWVAPAGFPFRHASARLDPTAQTFWNYQLATPLASR